MANVAGHRASFTQSWRTVETELVPATLVQRLCIGHFFVMQNGAVYKGIFPLLPDSPPGTIEKLKMSGELPRSAPRSDNSPGEAILR